MGAIEGLLTIAAAGTPIALSRTMRPRITRWLVGMALAGAAMLGASAGRAQTAVLLSPPDSSEIRELRVAHASVAERSALWFSLRIYGGADDVFVIVPAPEGAAVDLSSDAWFEALSSATNPRVLPPTAPPSCAAKPAADALEQVGDDQHAVTLSPLGEMQVQTFAQLVSWTQSQGLALTIEQATYLADLEVQGHRFITLRFQPAAGESITHTVRVTPSSQLTAVPLLLTSSGSKRVPTTVWELSSGRAWPASLPALTVDGSKLHWLAKDSQSNYRSLVDSMLGSADGHAWIVDSASHEALFRSTAIAGGSLSVPSVSATYFERAAGYGDAAQGYLACNARFAALESSTAPVAKVCPQGALGWVQSSAACSETPAPGETPADELRCGPGADDLAIAFSGSIPAQMWVTRWTGWIPPWSSRPREQFEHKAGPAIGPTYRASAYEQDCEGDGGTPGSDGGGAGGWPGSGGSSGAGGSGGSGSGSGSTPPIGAGAYGGSPGNQPSDPYPPDEEDCPDCWGGGQADVYVDGSSCSGDSSSSSSSDSCSGDSSPEDDSPDSCSGDTDSEGGDSCSGDSSSDSGDSCSGDSSDSGGGDSCSGSSSDGGPESCSGSSSGSSSDCSVSRRAGRRLPPLSGLTVSLAALLLPLRRWRRSR